MSSLRRKIDKIKPHFEKGGKFEKFHSTFNAFETFIFVPDQVTIKGSHVRDAMDLKRTMTIVIIAMLPPLLFGAYNIGLQHFSSLGVDSNLWQNFWFGFVKVLPLLIVSYGVGLGIEFIAAQIRGHEVNEGFLVTGMLIPLVMPVDVPLWMLALATAFSVIIGKEVFGGTGMNIFNPALMARAFLFFSYPGWMTGDKVWVEGLINATNVADGYSGATPLGELALGGGIQQLPSLLEMTVGTIPGSIGETSKIAILLGALILIITGIGSWKIMLSMFLGGASIGLLFNIIGANPYMQVPFYYHFLMGGFAFGAVYMATDPVTASQTSRGKWIYGFLIGFLSVLFRVLNPAYPEGVMLAILLMNLFAPLIDYSIIQASVNRRARRAQALNKLL
ncbi:MAG TPA: NADH:ubiquinone reductase (Na(+)-transporting) subunit B [Bacteroidales bacterium]|nr:NADH:ubiquinone reductase (Na(+)-transporting) subunit B [Bacteroidales bacterium]